MKTLILPAALLATASAVLANGGGYLTGIKSTGPFRPVNVDSVEMVSEKLDIELKPDTAAISIVYQLHNPGAAVDVEMGFPCAVTVKREYKEGTPDPIPLKSLPQLEDFKLTVDGKPVESKLAHDHAILPSGVKKGEYPGVVTGWQVVKVPFAAGQTSTVAVSYLNPYYRSVNYSSDNADKSAPSMSYLFSAAGLWKGAIKKGEVTIRATGLSPEKVKLSHPKRFTQDGRTWTWNFTDFEPTLQDDLEIVAGDTEFSQIVYEKGKYLGVNVRRGSERGKFEEMKKTGEWSFLSSEFTVTATSRQKKPFRRDDDSVLRDEDGNILPPRFPWVEGVDGDGIGESVTLTMTRPLQAARLRIHNGHRTVSEEQLTDMTKETFQERSRVKKLGVSINGGPSFSAEIPDSYLTEGIIELPPGTGEVKTIKLTIEEAYPGTRLRETCLSSVEVEIPLAKPPAIHRSR